MKTSKSTRSGPSRPQRVTSVGQPKGSLQGIKWAARRRLLDYLTFQIEIHPVDQFLLPSETVAEFLKRLRAVRIKLKKGDDVYRGRPSDVQTLSLVESGLIELSFGSAKSRPRRLVEPGSVFGEAPLLGMDTFGAKAVALEDSQICVVNSKAVEKRMYDYPETSGRWLGHVALMTSKAERKKRMLVFGSPEIRLAALVLDLAAGETILNVTQAEIAQRLGVRREIVSVILKSWRRKRLVRKKRGAIEIVKGKQLEGMVAPFF